MKNTLAKILGAAAIVLAIAQTSQAAFITGGIGFSGSAQYDTSSVGTATKVINWINPTAQQAYGDFGSIGNGTPVIFTAPWTFNSSGVTPFWQVGGFTFNLLSSTIVFQAGNFLAVEGTGEVYGNGFQKTALNWSFSTQNPNLGNNSFTFSASSNSVPDGGATVALLGLALSGVGMLRKKLTA